MLTRSDDQEEEYIMIKPLGDRVVIRVLEQEEKTASGIFLPDTAKEKPSQGEVVAVGSGKLQDNGTRTPLEVSVGDKIIFSKYAGTEVKYEGVDYLIVSERDILATI
ncbi:chaperonin GroS [Anaeroglobus geminatus F0357]|uniref:Co-chaperonin GroES n=2 Tax=Anaeroglobus TaxID=156454 RepID=G9YHJ4_9FIRM|nr:chaperonin GroS [Anaeroglobus geminatus F0357]